MVENKKLPQRLYLAKGDNDDDNIFVDTICLPQHQYDGIRFLYKLYKKGRAGAILNDPSGYGKRVQTVLFLNALRPVMTLPMLILCTDGKEQTWSHRFNKWTNMGPDINIQKSHEIIKPICIISTFYYMNILSRREWGVVVIDDNTVTRDMIRSGFNTKFKIWLTSMDMRKNLQTFSLIYKWFYPKGRFVVEDFQAIKKTPSIILTKSAKLDAFVEEIVIRRKDVILPLGKAKPTPQPLQVTRKNKDVTGKKIKRSKPLPEYSEENSEPQEKVAVQYYEDIERKNESIEDFAVSVGNDKQNKLEIDFTLLNNHGDIEKDSTDKLEDKNEEMSEIMVELNKDAEERNIVMEYYDGDELLNNASVLSQNIVIKYDSDTPDIDDDDIPAKRIKHDTNSKENQIDNKDLFSIDTLQSDTNEKVQNHDTVINNSLESKKNYECFKENEIHSVDVFSADITVNEVKGENEINNFNCVNNEVVNKNNISDINKTDPKLDGVELKIKQMEELATKKFKGSFLDKLF